MKAMSKVFLATTSLIALTVATHAQTLINQTVTGPNSLTSGNTARLINTPGFGAVQLQAFQDAVNSVNNGSTNYSGTTGSVVQTISNASSGALSLTTNNSNAAFSQNGPQLVQGAQQISSDVNKAVLTLTNGAIITLQQNNPGAINSVQNNIISAGYNAPSGGSFGIGQGPATIQGQSVTGAVVLSNAQNNVFNLNTTTISASGASTTVAAAQSPGAVTSTQTNFADAGQASPTFIDPSIANLNQTVTAKANQISSTAAATGSTLILDGAGTNVSKQSIGTASLDSFTVQNTSRALTWSSTTGSTGAGAFNSISGGTGDVSVSSSNQTVTLDFNRISAGTTAIPQNVNFGGSGAGAVDQVATYGSTTTTSQGVVITNQPVGGFANFGVTTSPGSDTAANVALAATANGAAEVTGVNQSASATLNTVAVTGGAVNGNLNQTASINTVTGSGTGTAGAAVGAGPQLSNFAGAVVQVQGPATLFNVDQDSTLSSNSLTSGSIGADGLTVTQTGYQTKAASFTASPSAGAVNPGLSSNVVIASSANGTTLGSNTSISGSQQSITAKQNTFTTTSSTNGASSAAQFNITQSLTAPTIGSVQQDQAYGGDNLALATAGPGNGNGSLSGGTQTGTVDLNNVRVTTTGSNTQTGITQTGNGTSGDPLSVAGFNTGSATGRTATIAGYGQSYDVSMNTVTLGGSGTRTVTQTSGGATVNTGNTFTAAENSSSPVASVVIGSVGSSNPFQTLTASVNKASIASEGSLSQTAGPVTSTLNNTATATASSSATSSITGLVQTTSQSINTGL